MTDRQFLGQVIVDIYDTEAQMEITHRAPGVSLRQIGLHVRQAAKEIDALHREEEKANKPKKPKKGQPIGAEAIDGWD